MGSCKRKPEREERIKREKTGNRERGNGVRMEKEKRREIEREKRSEREVSIRYSLFK